MPGTCVTENKKSRNICRFGRDITFTTYPTGTWRPNDALPVHVASRMYSPLGIGSLRRALTGPGHAGGFDRAHDGWAP